jgi:hypothetical protein
LTAIMLLLFPISRILPGTYRAAVIIMQDAYECLF